MRALVISIHLQTFFLKIDDKMATSQNGVVYLNNRGLTSCDALIPSTSTSSLQSQQRQQEKNASAVQSVLFAASPMQLHLT